MNACPFFPGTYYVEIMEQAADGTVRQEILTDSITPELNVAVQRGYREGELRSARGKAFQVCVWEVLDVEDTGHPDAVARFRIGHQADLLERRFSAQVRQTAARLAEQSARQATIAQAETQEVLLSDCEVDVLLTLADKRYQGRPLLMYQLVAAAARGRSQVFEAVRNLIALGYVARPAGSKRKGVAITPAGLQRAAALAQRL